MKLTVYWLAWQGSSSTEMIPCARNGVCIYPGEDFSHVVIGFSEEELLSTLTPTIAGLVTIDDPNWSIQSFEFNTEEV